MMRDRRCFFSPRGFDPVVTLDLASQPGTLLETPLLPRWCGPVGIAAHGHRLAMAARIFAHWAAELEGLIEARHKSAMGGG